MRLRARQSRHFVAQLSYIAGEEERAAEKFKELLPHDAELPRCRMDGKRLASAGDRTVKIWDATPRVEASPADAKAR